MQNHYDKDPAFPAQGRAEVGWGALLQRVENLQVILCEFYPGVDRREFEELFLSSLPASYQRVDVGRHRHGADRVEAMLARHLGDDRVFGYMSPYDIADFYPEDVWESLARKIAGKKACVYGVGASLLLPFFPHATLVYLNMARWEIQLRMRAGMGNWSCSNENEEILKKYKRGYFVEWRAADRLKRTLFDRIDMMVDANKQGSPITVSGEHYRQALRDLCCCPFRLRPFFDPAPWGGQWMKDVCHLDRNRDNFGWCFDCVPEENSLLLDFDGGRLEIPAIDLVLYQPLPLLGEQNYARFGAEFPIRFDLLDTMGGGNLSLQVHPSTDYIRQTFGMHYTQDESYYLLDAAPDGCVYLGLKSGIDTEELWQSLERAQRGEQPFDDERFVNKFPAAKHDHLLIPAGTIHCSGNNTMVLEISATPYIFTFKLWDWGRLGLDGKPRPVHLKHGRCVLREDRDTEWVRSQLINVQKDISAGDGWREERTGLHQLEFIETRRTWFKKPFTLRPAGTVNVLNLVQGEAAEIISPTAAFPPYTVHYAETFVVPAAVEEYQVRPLGKGEHALLRAWVRGSQL